jgi:hypothetical protein
LAKGVTGRVEVDGKVISHHSAKKMFGYVMQDDVIHSNLTVKEALYYAAMVTYLYTPNMSFCVSLTLSLSPSPSPFFLSFASHDHSQMNIKWRELKK